MNAAQEAKERARNGAAQQPPPNGAHGADTSGAPEPAAPARKRWYRGAEIGELIVERSNDPWVDLRFGNRVVVRSAIGTLHTITGGTGSGKTSAALTIAGEHLRDGNPVVMLSIELPVHHAGARIVGIDRHESWERVLRGAVDRDAMTAVLPENLVIIDRRVATIETLVEATVALQADYPGRPVLAIVDYLQILGNAEDQRLRVTSAMEELADYMHDHRAVVLALSQGSRASSRDLAEGTKRGNQVTDTGAEAAAIERFSTFILGIGKQGKPDEFQTRPVEMSIAKGRMSGADFVQDCRYHAVTGRWEAIGEPRPAADVAAAEASDPASPSRRRMRMLIVGALDASREELSRNEIYAVTGGNKGEFREELSALLADPSSGVVEVGARRVRNAYKLWTRAHAVRASKSIVERADAPTGPGAS